MENFDSQMAARVWQRVQGDSKKEDLSAALPLFLQKELTELNRYHQLSITLGGISKSNIEQLIKITQQCISVLRGIHLLLTNTVPQVTPSPLPKELPISVLRRCYGTSLHQIAQYEHWGTYPEYGPGFVGLSKLSRQRCLLLLQLLGSVRP